MVTWIEWLHKFGDIQGTMLSCETKRVLLRYEIRIAINQMNVASLKFWLKN